MTIQSIWDRLDKQCQESLDSIAYVNKSEYLATDDLKRVQDLVVKQAFLNVFTEWEHFLEDSTIAYALGEKSIRGFAPTKYINPLDEDHADRLIKGTSTYPDWSKMKVVLSLESALFEDGEPYRSALNGFASKYKDMQKVRNVIVHNSIKSRDEFDSLVRTALYAASVGISPTEFLLSQKGSDPKFYISYIAYIRNAGKMIAEYSSSSS